MKKSLLLFAAFGLAALQGQAQCPTGETQVTLNLVLDRYGSETTWSATGPGGSPSYASGGPYTDAAASGEYPLPPVTFCVPNGSQFIVTVDDSYGDGLCCAYGEGGYTVSVGGNVVAGGNGVFSDAQSSAVFMGTDLSVGVLSMETVVAQGPLTVAGTVLNTGTASVTGFTLSYSVDGGAPVSTPISATLAPGGSYSYEHPTTWNAVVGPHDLNITISNINGDAIAANNTFNAELGVASQSEPRVTVIEQFTSSTCPPCAGLNTTFAPTLDGLNTNDAGSNVAAIKYHLNFPNPGNDPSYNPDANTRRGYYDVQGIPDLYIDGKPMASVAAAYIQEQAARNAFVDLDLDYTLTGNTIDVTVGMTPYWAYTGAHKLHIAIVENSYNYAASTTNQDQFHYVQRKMMPNGSGNTLTALVDGVTQTVNRSHTIVLGNPAPGNYNTWGTNLNNLTLVAFVQNTATKEILQAAFAPLSTSVSVAENALDQQLSVFPNPTADVLNVRYEAAGTGSTQIEVFNVLGGRVFGTTRAVAAGNQLETIDMSALSNGIYFVNITADGMRASRKVTLNK